MTRQSYSDIYPISEFTLGKFIIPTPEWLELDMSYQPLDINKPLSSLGEAEYELTLHYKLKSDGKLPAYSGKVVDLSDFRVERES